MFRPRPAGPFGALPPALRPLLALTLAGVAFTVCSALLHTRLTRSLDEPVQIATLLLAAVLVLARPVLVRVERAPWTCLGLAILAWAVAEIIRTAAVHGAAPAPVVTSADVAYLPCYPLLYLALLLLIRAKAVPFDRVVWLDGVVGLLGLGAVVLTAAYGPIVAATGRDPSSTAVGLTYVVGDLTLVGLIVLALAAAGFRERTWWVIAAAGALETVADVLWLTHDPTAAATADGWPNVLWPLAAVLFVVAAWRAPLAVRTLRLTGWPVLVMPAAAVLGALVVLVAGTVHRLPVAAVGLAAASLAGALLRAALTVREVQQAAASQHQAVTDELTGLGNRRLLLRQLETVLADLPAGAQAALLLLDLDRFKEINDTLGHPVGDEVLGLLGPRLAGATDPAYTLARLGGDEFGILLPSVLDEAAAVAAAEKVLAALAAPFGVDGLTLYAVGSIGVAIAPGHGTDPATLLRRADVAMYEAKRARQGCTVYREEQDRNARSRLEAVTELRQAVENGQLTCYYQPQVELASGNLVGFEALARWRHPGGVRLPAEFLDLAEQAGLMERLTDTVLHTALADCRSWRCSGTPGVTDLRVSVNLAASTLRDCGLLDRIGGALAAADLPAAALVVEITEESLVTDTEQVIRTLAGLHELGVGVSIDDFGTGYSSLSYLRNLPADELKLDRSFVTGLPSDPRVTAIVRHTVQLAHALGVTVVAEGVADAGTMGALRTLRCDRVQGYHIAAPLAPPAVPAWLRARIGPPVVLPR